VGLWIACGSPPSLSGKRENNLRTIRVVLHRDPSRSKPSAIPSQGYPLIDFRSVSMLFFNDTSSFVFFSIIFTAYMTVE